MPQSRRGAAFFALAFAFLALGITGNRAFLAIAMAFLAIGIAFMRRQER